MMRRALGGMLLMGCLLGAGAGAIAQPTVAPDLPQAPAPEPSPAPLPEMRQVGICPVELDRLMPLLLRDLPSYANRVIQRARVRDRPADISGYILLSSPAEIDAPPFAPGNPPPLPPINPTSTVQQVFFTTLERQYGVSGFFQIQAHHRLFLTLTDDGGWRVVLMQTIWDDYPEGNLLSEPRDSTHGVVAQAIELWLRDCRAGAVDLAAP